MLRYCHLVMLLQFYMISMVMGWLFIEFDVMYPVIAALYIKEQLLKEHMVTAKGEGHTGEGFVSCKGEGTYAKDKAIYAKDKTIYDKGKKLWGYKRKAVIGYICNFIM
eukprot:432788_1